MVAGSNPATPAWARGLEVISYREKRTKMAVFSTEFPSSNFEKGNDSINFSFSTDNRIQIVCYDGVIAYKFSKAKMKEELIARTSIYLPKELFLLAKKKQINISKMFRIFLEEMMKDDEVEILKREIEELERRLEEKKAKLSFLMEERKRKEREEEAITKIVGKITSPLSIRFSQWMESFKPEDKARIVYGISKIVKDNYGIEMDKDFIITIFENAMNNGSKIKVEEVKKSDRRKMEGKEELRVKIPKDLMTILRIIRKYKGNSVIYLYASFLKLILCIRTILSLHFTS